MKLLFIAPVDKFSVKDTGYGTAAAGIAYVLKRMEKEGRISKLYFLNTTRPIEKDIPKENVDVAIITVHPNSFFQQSKALHIVRKAIEKAERTFLSIVWETSPLPSKWQAVFDEPAFNAFIAPSYFVASEIRKMTDKPVYYYPHYIHVDDIPQVNIEEKMKETQFTSLYIGQHTKRKGLEDAIVAFIRALGNVKDARLVLKYHRMTDREINPEQMIYHAVSTNSIKPVAKVYSITEMLDREKMYSLYHMSSVLFSPSRGEGFGLPIAEAMASGIGVIYTGWSAMPEVGSAEGNIALRYTLDESIGMFHHGYDIGSKYAVPLMSDCIDALRSMYSFWRDDKKEFYTKVRSNRDVIIKRFGYKPVSACIEHFSNWNDGFAPEWIHKEMHNATKGIASNNILGDRGQTR